MNGSDLNQEARRIKKWKCIVRPLVIHIVSIYLHVLFNNFRNLGSDFSGALEISIIYILSSRNGNPHFPVYSFSICWIIRTFYFSIQFRVPSNCHDECWSQQIRWMKSDLVPFPLPPRRQCPQRESTKIEKLNLIRIKCASMTVFLTPLLLVVAPTDSVGFQFISN